MDALTSRHTALLPIDARDERSIFKLEAPYRVDGSSLVDRAARTSLRAAHRTLVGYDGHFPSDPALDLRAGALRRPEDIRVRHASREQSAWGDDLGLAAPPATRRFCWKFAVDDTATVSCSG